VRCSWLTVASSTGRDPAPIAPQCSAFILGAIGGLTARTGADWAGAVLLASSVAAICAAVAALVYRQNQSRRTDAGVPQPVSPPVDHDVRAERPSAVQSRPEMDRPPGYS